jgi:antitoxin HicB
MANEFRYTAVFEPAEEGGFIVTFPAIPGLATQGETMDEARAMAVDCLRAYLESLRKDGEPLPYEASEGPITERLTVELASA